MVSSSNARGHTKKRQDAVDEPSVRRKSSAVSLVSGPKPLKNYHFYLDVKNHLTSSKLESKIKNLGGVLEVFLVRNVVTHVISDREEWSSAIRGVGSTPRTPPQDVSSVTPPLRGRPKTRAEAMLEKARNTPTNATRKSPDAGCGTTNDPLEQATIWNIPIWSIKKISAWLNKITASLSSKNKKECVELKAPYVKFEAFDRSQRPVFKEIRNWPEFNLGAGSGVALIHAKDRNMTKSSRATPKKINVATIATNNVKNANNVITAGYCEICREEFQVLKEHLVSEKHVAFGKDDHNYLQLDSFIQETKTDLSSLLLTSGIEYGLVGDKANNQLSGVQHKMPRTRTSSICDKVKNAPVSPTGSETKNRLRTRKSNMTFLTLAPDEEVEASKIETRELRSSHKKADTWNSGRPKRRSCIAKRLSINDDPILLNEQRNYYKIEMTPKLRSANNTAALAYKEFLETPKKAVLSPVSSDHNETADDVDDKSLIVKFRRMRSSELRQLNDEAENFLFPKKDDGASSSEDDPDGDCRDTTASSLRADKTVSICSEDGDAGSGAEEGVLCESDDDGGGGAKKPRRRLTHAEAFILDNKKYYKFETPGSRLRHHGAAMLPTSTPDNNRNNGDCTFNADASSVNSSFNVCDDKVQSVKKGTEESGDGDGEKWNDIKFTLDELKFSFETIPKSEPWYETFSRQDNGAEYYTCFSDSGYWKPLLLPYEMDKIEPLDPKVCISTYTQIKKLLAEETASGSGTCSTTDSSQPSPPPDLQDEESKASMESDSCPAATDDAKATFQDKQLMKRQASSKNRRKRGALVASKNPRKSPRQHASTLAILSSLIHNRKKRKSGSDKSLDAIQEQQEDTLDDIDCPEKENVERSELEEISQSIDNMLKNAFEDVEIIELSDVEDGVLLDGRSDAIEILEDYENHKHEARKTGLVSNSRRSYSPGKKPGRKKKKNRTGWPKNSVRRTLIGNLGLSKGGQAEESFTDLDDSTVSADSAAVAGEQGEEEEDDSKKDVIVNNRKVVNNVNGSSNADRVTSNGSVVDLDQWENAEKVLSAKLTNNDVNDVQFQPIVRVEKFDSKDEVIVNNRRLRSSSSPHRTSSAKRARRMPASPKSPRVLRKPRGRWYRER